MKRVRKFRVWDITNKRMVYKEGGCYLIGLNGRLFDLDGNPYDEQDIIQEYTGLKDQHGQEIHEGDIVQWSGLLYLVEWDDAGFKWQARCPYYHRYHHPKVDHFRYLESGVIKGNIVENPQLLYGILHQNNS